MILEPNVDILAVEPEASSGVRRFSLGVLAITSTGITAEED